MVEWIYWMNFSHLFLLSFKKQEAFRKTRLFCQDKMHDRTVCLGGVGLGSGFAVKCTGHIPSILTLILLHNINTILLKWPLVKSGQWTFSGAFPFISFFPWQMDCSAFLLLALQPRVSSLQVTCEASAFLTPEGRVRKVIK